MDKTVSRKRIFLNTFSGVFGRLVIAILGIFLRRFFIKYLGAETSGLNSLFGNIIDFLNLASAGLMTGAMPQLYEFNAHKDYNGISRIMKMMTGFYAIISVIIFFGGLLISIFIQIFISNISFSIEFIRITFMSSVIVQCVRNLIAPKQGLLLSRERNYVYLLTELAVNIAVYIVQGIVIIYSGNYLMYILVNLVGQFILLVLVGREIDFIYPWLKHDIKVNLKDLENVFLNVKYTVFIQISNFIFMSTDSIVLSSSLGLIQTNLYTNYLTIATSVDGMCTSLESAVRIYFGNKIHVDYDLDEKRKSLKMSTHLYFLIGGICGIVYCCLIDDFISLWLGNRFTQGRFLASSFAIYIFLKLLFGAAWDYTLNVGLFQIELVANIVSAFVNIMASILGVVYFGISGVIIGTICGVIAMFAIRCYGAIKDAKEAAARYILDIVIYITVFSLALAGVLSLCKLISISNLFFQMVMKFMVAFQCSGFIFCFVFSWKKEQKIIYEMIRDTIGKIKNKINYNE